MCRMLRGPLDSPSEYALELGFGFGHCYVFRVLAPDATSSFQLEMERVVASLDLYISGPKGSTHPTGRKIERSCGVAEGPEVLFTLARPAE